MSAKRFAAIVASLRLNKDDQKWFPLWIFKFASSRNVSRSEQLVIDFDSVIHFSRGLRDGDVPAWQRLQAVRAIDCYRKSILESDEPRLDKVLAKLQQIVTTLDDVMGFVKPEHPDRKWIRQSVNVAINRFLKAGAIKRIAPRP